MEGPRRPRRQDESGPPPTRRAAFVIADILSPPVGAASRNFRRRHARHSSRGRVTDPAAPAELGDRIQRLEPTLDEAASGLLVQHAYGFVDGGDGAFATPRSQGFSDRKLRIQRGGVPRARGTS